MWSETIDRRTFVRTTGALVAAVGLAGCGSPGEDDDEDGEDDAVDDATGTQDGDETEESLSGPPARGR